VVFLYYLLVLYVAKFTPEIYSKYQEIISFLLNEKIVYATALVVTVITLHSGYLYLSKNWQIIKRMTKVEN
jgi:hypothetical protein